MTDTPGQFDDVLDALALGEMTEEEQEEVLNDIGDIITEGTMVRLVEKMDDATRDAFTALLDTDPSEDAVEAYILEHVPDADAVVTEVVAELTRDIVAATQP
jgi:hypothetical protein